MNLRFKTTHKPFAAAVAVIALSTSMQAFAADAIDADAAETLGRQSGCFKCHGIDKRKDGPAYRDVAAKYKDKSDAESRLITHITSGKAVKFRDGREEEHKIVKSKNEEEIKNLVRWILSQ